MYLPPGTGGTAGGTGGGGGPEDSVVVAEPEVTPAGVSVLEARSSTLIILLTSDNLIFIVSNHNSVCSNMVLEHLFASMITMERRFSLSEGISRQEILLIILK